MRAPSLSAIKRLRPRLPWRRGERKPTRPPSKWRAVFWALAAAAVAFGIGLFLHHEVNASQIQSRYYAQVASELTWEVEPGPSDRIVFPGHGPYDETLGYARLPEILDRLTRKGFIVSSQARLSPAHLRLVKRGVYPIYREKGQAGLTIIDETGQPLFGALYPQLVYGEFARIPDVIVQTLLLIENRELLDPRYPYKNPVVEWGRLGRATLDLVISKFAEGHDVPGASTLATQIEKYRHSPEGRTSGIVEKIRQMRSATLRAYRDGRDTNAARRRVITDYIDSVPLGAQPGTGEIRGLGHGLAAWHGASFTEVNGLLADVGDPATMDPATLKAKATAYKQVLSLFLAQRRPAYYLQQSQDALRELVDRHLGVMARAGVISEGFRAAVAAAPLPLRPNAGVFQPERLSFPERKGANAVRVYLLGAFGLDRLYSLDRMDLKVTSTIDYAAQKAVTALLAQLKDREFAKSAGLMDDRLLAKGDPAEVVYSFTLRERVGDANVLRVQADNVDGPFNVSEGGKLELGSTAKLRTLVSYLQVVERLWTELKDKKPGELGALAAGSGDGPRDPLTKWAAATLVAGGDAAASLAAFLGAAMDRTYSASPAEAFFTGGGVHHFSNFDKKDNGRTVSMRESLRKSINLPFVRVMRDVVAFFVQRIPGAGSMLVDPQDPQRRLYLTRFAAKEGRDFLGRFYLKYRGLPQSELLKTLLRGLRLTPRRLAAIDKVVRPEANAEAFVAFAHPLLPTVGEGALKSAWSGVAKSDFGLHDQAYVAGLHPLELWLVAFLYRVPDANYSQVMEQSEAARQESYRWLFNSSDKGKQDKRIRMMLDQEAFQALHALWADLGYPFASLVPTYATALGSSGDKPSALADLMGIVASGGIRRQPARVTALDFAVATPYETHVATDFEPGTRVLSAEIATVVKDALRDVVENGTAIRVKGAFVGPDGKPLPVGGKTGTGDNRYSIFAPGGRVIESKAKSRTATFVFYVGERFFGTLTAYVPSAAASEFNFTSALPAQILKILAPGLSALINRPEGALTPPPVATKVTPKAPPESEKP
jgi:membrane peptidoglycan carboxypeptidase